MSKRLYVIDGMAFAFRSYFAIPHLRDSRGNPTNAVYGFARVLLKILREEKPSHLVLVFDAPGKVFREDLYPDYKKTRKETPEDLLAQFPVIDRLAEAFEIPVLRVPLVEADDVMGTLAKRAEQWGVHTVLVTNDKDMLQLVNGNTSVYDPNKGDKGKWYDAEAVRERYGVGPEGVIEVLGLIGDSVDNVPGVKGIGEKTAKKLLEQYGTIAGIYEKIDELKGKQKERLLESRELAELSRQLVTIDTAVEFECDFDSFECHELNRLKLAEIFGELEFQSLLEEFLPDASTTEVTDYCPVLSEADLDKLVKELREAGSFAVDTETTSTDPMRAELVGISLCCKECQAWYVPVGHVSDAMTYEGRVVKGVPRETALAKLKPLLEDPTVGKVGHNIKYDLIVLKRAGIDLQGLRLDTMVASYLTDPSRLRHNLNEVSLQYLKRKMIPIADVIGKGSKAITFSHVPLEAACAYAAEDADITWRLVEVFSRSLRERELEPLYREVEQPLIDVLARMEMAGVAIDSTVFDRLQREIEQRLIGLETEIFELAGEKFTINSPKQLQRILFEVLGLPPARKTKTGYSTDVDVLEQLALEHPLPEKLLEYRTLDKLRGTYVEALPKLVNPDTGRIHTSFNQAVAATGRLSSSDPNLQNIPIRTEMGRRIREGFVPGQPGYRLISADYSQIELRILAHLTADPALKEAFREDKDIHADTAARVFGVNAGSVTAEMRRKAKAVNFGVIYGISPFGLARSLGISQKEAGTFIDRYFEQYPGVRKWIERTKAEALETGYVKTMLNRRRYVPELHSRIMSTRRAAERIAMNTPVQGTAADVIKLAMLRLDEALAGSRAQMLLQVHDELLVEAPAEEAEATATTMREIMENALELDVPLKVDVGIGANWAEVH